jgi:AraC family ethanolamine operon transcriptional activator
VRDLEFNLIRQLLLAITGSQPKHEIKLTSRKRIVLQRARNYIEANADRAITVLELAQAAGSCVRTLEYVFREYFDVTPKAFLKSRRLAAVRRELLRPLNSRFSVTEIANRWGFWHMSQFAADYRRFFGENELAAQVSMSWGGAMRPLQILIQNSSSSRPDVLLMESG